MWILLKEKKKRKKITARKSLVDRSLCAIHQNASQFLFCAVRLFVGWMTDKSLWNETVQLYGNCIRFNKVLYRSLFLGEHNKVCDVAYSHAFKSSLFVILKSNPFRKGTSCKSPFKENIQHSVGGSLHILLKKCL